MKKGPAVQTKAAASPPLPAPRAGNLPLAARPGRQARRVHAREKVYNSCNAAGPPPGTLLPGHARLARPGTTERRDMAAREMLSEAFFFSHIHSPADLCSLYARGCRERICRMVYARYLTSQLSAVFSRSTRGRLQQWAFRSAGSTGIHMAQYVSRTLECQVCLPEPDTRL